MMKRVATVIPFLALCLLSGTKSVYSINLAGVEVPKDKFIVYIMIGHSNMSGRTNEKDVTVHPRAWNFFIQDCCQKELTNHTWIPAQDCIHKDFSGSGGGPCMHFLKKMVNEFPDYYFGVVENGNSGVTCRGNYLKDNEGGELDLFSEMVGALDTIKESVTFGGIICMLGVPEAVLAPESVCQSFSADIALMVQQFRDTLGLPELPFLMGAFERDGPEVKKQGTYWAIIDSQTNLVPSVVPVSDIIPSDSLVYFDRWHYTNASYEIWTQRAIDIIKAHRWLPMITGDKIHFRYTTSAPMFVPDRQSIVCDALGKKIYAGFPGAPHSDEISSSGKHAWSILLSKNKKALSGPP